MIDRLRVFAAAVFLLAVCGCSDSGGRLIGKWRQVPEGRVYNFQSGGQVTGIVNGRAVSGTWEVKQDRENSMVVNIATSRGEAPDATVKFDGPDKFDLTDSGQQLHFERQK
jgi:hypothetical protein